MTNVLATGLRGVYSAQWSHTSLQNLADMINAVMERTEIELDTGNIRLPDDFGPRISNSLPPLLPAQSAASTTSTTTKDSDATMNAVQELQEVGLRLSNTARKAIIQIGSDWLVRVFMNVRSRIHY